MSVDMDALLRQATDKIKALKAEIKSLKQTTEDFAIVGMSCQFPGCKDLDEFWQLLVDGKEAISTIPASRWDVTTTDNLQTSSAGIVDDIALFDAAFFSITPLEATYMSPEQRMLLQNTWHALEDAGLTKEAIASQKTGVFIGACPTDYQRVIAENSTCTNVNAYYASGNSLATASGRIAYTFNLAGPCLTIDTACSSSLHALHLACQSIRAGECQIAIVGGVNAILTPHESVCFSQANMLSPDGKCKTFDETANGYVRGEGCGVVIVKALSTAIADGDEIVAVIKGTATGQDGASGGLTVPSGIAQQQVMQDALAASGVSPHEVSYIEAHGTATSLGDPIELAALQKVYEKAKRDTSLYVGSVKTNIGHLEAAAGIAGVIKVALAIKHATIPAHLNVNKPTSRVEWQNTVLKIPIKTQPWERFDTASLIAGVSSFSFSGSNAHVVIAEHQIETKSSPRKKPPKYEFKKSDYWVGKSNLITKRCQLVVATKELVVYNFAINCHSNAIWQDHCIQGELVFPATAIVELLMACHTEHASLEPTQLKQIIYIHPLMLCNDEVNQLQIEIQQDDKRFAIFSTTKEKQGHTTGSLNFDNVVVPNSSLPELNDEHLVLSGADQVQAFYEKYAANGLQYGPAFQLVNAIWSLDNCFVGRIVCQQLDNFYVNPAQLDACMQVTGFYLLEYAKGEMFVPAKINAVNFFSALPKVVYCVCRISELTQGYHVDIDIFSEQGEICITIEGLQLKRFPKQMSQVVNNMADQLNEEIILNLIKSIAGFSYTDPLDVHQSLDTIGFDSIMFMQLQSKLHTKYQVDITILELMAAESIAALLHEAIPGRKL